MNSIYALVDPRNDELRYIGKSRNPEQRLAGHCRTRNKTRCSRWVQKLRQFGLRPTMIIIEEHLSETEWPDREKFWIAHYKSLGADLTNITDGGHHVVNTRRYFADEICILTRPFLSRIAKEKNLHGTEYKVLFFILSRIDYDNKAMMTQAFIANELDMPQPQVSAAIKKLVECGAVRKTSSGGMNGYLVNADFASKGSLKK